MGNPPNNLPPPPEPDPQFQQADVVNDVKRDWKEKLFGALSGGRGGQLDNAIQQHHQARLDEARMNRRNASTAQSQIFYLNKYGINPETYEDVNDPSYKGESKEDLLRKYNNQYLAAMNNYTKIAGVNPETKQAIAKARQIVEYLTGQQGQQAPAGQGAAPPPTPQYPTNVSDTGVSYVPPDRPGSMPPPPTPNYRTNVSDAGVSFSAPPTPTGGGATAMIPPVAAYTDANGLYHPALKHRSAAEIENAAAPVPTPQAAAAPSAPPDMTNFSEQAPFIRGDFKVQQKTAQGLQTAQVGVQGRHKIVKDVLGMDDDDIAQNPALQDYVLTGNIVGGALQGMFQQGSKYIKDANGIPRLSIFNKRTGKYLDPTTMAEIPGATPMSASDLATKTINQMTPDGPRTMFRVGNKVYDNHGVLQDGELVPFIRGMVPTTTDREVMGFDEQGNPTKYILRSTRTVNVGPVPSPVAQPTAGGTVPVATGATTKARSGGVTPPPQAQGGTTKASAGKAGGKVFPAGQFGQFSKGATGVDQARNSLVGDNIEKGEVGGLAKDLDVFKNQDSMKRIGEYLQLVHNQAANEGDSFAHAGDTVGAVKWFVGLPQLNITLQQGALRDQYDQLTDQEKKFVADYFRVMGTMGGMRASTGMPGYQWAFTNMYNEMPTPGKVNNYDDAVRRLMNYVNETNVVSKRNPLVPKVNVTDAEKQIRSTGRSGGATQPPTASGGTIRFSDNGTNYNIPAAMVSEFQKDHPNAKRQ